MSANVAWGAFSKQLALSAESKYPSQMVLPLYVRPARKRLWPLQMMKHGARRNGAVQHRGDCHATRGTQFDAFLVLSVPGTWQRWILPS